jgi:hypothetical protein
MTKVKRCGTIVLAAGALVSACTRADDVTTATTPSTSAATTVPATTALPTTSAPTTVPATTAPATTVPPTTAPPPPTTAPPPPATAPPLTVASLILMSDGIGPFRFGTPGADLVAQLTGMLGAPSSDATTDYPVPVDGGYARDSFGEEVFAHPVGRATCFGNGLCVYSGGPTGADVAFVGWNFAGAVPPALATPTGVTTGSRWSAYPTMTVNEGGCYQEGSGSVDGIALSIVSEGTPFGGFDAAGNYVVGRPDPADAVVVNMQAGTQPGFPFPDC